MTVRRVARVIAAAVSVAWVWAALPAAGQTVQPPDVRFYFSGVTPETGRELWVLDPLQPPPAGTTQPFATLVDAAEGPAGADSGSPRAITPLGGRMFFSRLDAAGSRRWVTVSGNIVTDLAEVGESMFDGMQLPENRTLAVRAGDLVWLATPADELVAFDRQGQQVATLALAGVNRRALTALPDGVAYVARDTAGDEQVFAVLRLADGSGFQVVQVTTGAPATGLRALAGFGVTVPAPGSGAPAETTVFFAGSAYDQNGVPRTDALWRVTLADPGFGWAPTDVAHFLDINATGGGVPLAPHHLTAVSTSTRDRLFFFGQAPDGLGGTTTRLYALTQGPGGMPAWTSVATPSGQPLTAGLDIRPYPGGVVVSGVQPGSTGHSDVFLATWTDVDGDGALDLAGLFRTAGESVEHVSVDETGRVAFVVRAGSRYGLHVHLPSAGPGSGPENRYLVDTPFEIDEVQVAAGKLVYRTLGNLANAPTLYLYDIPTSTGGEVPTDRNTNGTPGSGYLAVPWRVPTARGMAFLGDPGTANGVLQYLTDGPNLLPVQGGNFRPSGRGVAVEGDWVGTGYLEGAPVVGLPFMAGLYRISGTNGTVRALHQDSTNFSDEVVVLGRRVLFGTSTSAINQVRVHDLDTGVTSVLLGGAVPFESGFLLGATGLVNGRVVFAALDRGRMENRNFNPADDVWSLFTWDGGFTAQLVFDLPIDPQGQFGVSPVLDWHGEEEFLAVGDRIYWRQNSGPFGREMLTADLAAANPAATVRVLEVAPTSISGAIAQTAAVVNGRVYWLASIDGSFGALQVWTTADGLSAQAVSGPDLRNPFGSPNELVTIGNELFFVALDDTTGIRSLFQVDDNGLTATRISPTPRTIGTIVSPSAVGGQLMFVGVGGVAPQVYRMQVGATPADALPPVAVTSFTEAWDALDGPFQGGDGSIYFARNLRTIGTELWVLDAAAPGGARLVADINSTVEDVGYDPQQVVAVLTEGTATSTVDATDDTLRWTFGASGFTFDVSMLLANDTGTDLRLDGLAPGSFAPTALGGLVFAYDHTGDGIVDRLGYDPPTTPEERLTTPFEDSFVYTARDAAGATDTATIRFAVDNTAPVAPDLTLTRPPGALITVSDLLAGASDADGDVLRVSDVRALGGATVETVVDPASGQLTGVRVTPTGGATTAQFTYTVTDSSGAFGNSDSGTVTVAPPVVSEPVFRIRLVDNTVPEGSSFTISGYADFVVERVSGAPTAANLVARASASGAVPADIHDIVGGFASSWVVFLDEGQNARPIRVYFYRDDVIEADETFTLSLTSTTAGRIDAAGAGVEVVIRNDDGADIRLALARTDGSSPVAVGGTATFLLTVANAGPEGTDGTVRFHAPPGTTIERVALQGADPVGYDPVRDVYGFPIVDPNT
ncbi:Ig-like domain-containing protein, partial [Luteitalea sp.]|uniref:Ig-like domain-containing protein n=1 Tax=Luteitalea sp. TaxID=2004800 RepID=UPI0025BB9905